MVITNDQSIRTVCLSVIGAVQRVVRKRLISFNFISLQHFLNQLVEQFTDVSVALFCKKEIQLV